jgi:phosphofructokinase-like protein
MRIGVLTGGGDCPGLNAAIRGVVRKGELAHGFEFVGFRYGWRGAMTGDTMPLSVATTHGLLHRGGTILRSSRTNPYKQTDGAQLVRQTMQTHGVDALVAIGGEDTLGVANKLFGDGVNVVGVPKTMDNDLSGTDYTFGFDTAVQTGVDAIDRLHSTAESHDRVIVVEVMGRHAGWVALYSGLAGGADAILIPEQPFDIDAVCAHVKRRREQGINFSIVVVAEGATPKAGTLSVASGKLDEFGHEQLGGIGDIVAREIEQRTGFETRATNLGHIVRGGTPTAYDRVLATRLGVAAIDAVAGGQFGKMVALRGTEIVTVPLSDAVSTLKTVDDAFLQLAEVFFG